MRTVTLYTREGCCLCDEAFKVLEAIRRDLEFQLNPVDVSSSRELELKYLERIPVVEIDGEEICEYTVDLETLKSKLEVEESR